MVSRRSIFGPDDVQRAREAAARWRDRAGFRAAHARDLREERYTRADTPVRIAARVERLGQWQAALGKRAEPDLDRQESMLGATARRPLQPQDVAEEAIERVIGSRDLMSIEFFEIGLDAARSVGRVTTGGSINGTGFLVGQRLLLTNNHVLPSEDFTAESQLELDVEEARFGPAKPMEVFNLDPDRFFMTDRDLDFTLVAVAPNSERGVSLDSYAFKPLIGAEGKAAVAECVNLIQHPGGEPKRVVVRNNQLIDLFLDQPDKPFFHYLADTEKGSSGCPVFNDQWELVALHHQSVPKTDAKGRLIDRSGRIIKEGDDPARIEWIANEGIRVSHLVRHIAARTDLPMEQLAIRDALLKCWDETSTPAAQLQAVVGRKEAQVATGRATTIQPDDPQVKSTALQAERAVLSSPAASGTPARLELLVPVRISVALGDVRHVDATDARADASAAATTFSSTRAPAQERIDPEPDYAGRPGFVPDFLGFQLHLPVLLDDRHGPVSALSDHASGELRYHHFSVVMNERRRLAYVAAVNIDRTAPFGHDREQGQDRWLYDPRLPRQAQAGTAYYQSNPLDRGHLVRRDDAAWGHSTEEAKLANDDTFHWTNCSPQHEIFNQAGKASQKGLQLWGNLELAVSRLAGRLGQKLCVFNGPVFDDHDRPYRQGFWLPSAYWKLIVVLDEDSRPHALAFRLSQAGQIGNLAREGFQPGEFAPFVAAQIGLPELEEITRLHFADLDGLADPVSRSLDVRETAQPAIILDGEAAIRF